MKFEELKGKSCGGIVLYNPDIIKLKRNIDSLEHQLGRIVLIDNASKNISDIENLLKQYENVELVRNSNNLGIAEALNQILDYAQTNDYEWYLSMDQDSCCDENLMAEYAKHFPKDSSVAILHPYVLNNSKVTLKEYKRLGLPETEWIKQPIDCITSGSLNRVSAAIEAGRYNSELFIDCVDVDFNLRLQLLHYQILRVNTTYMLQEMGEAKEVGLIQLLYKLTNKNTFRRLRYTPVYSDLRLYYISRNSRYIYRKYGKLAGKRMAPGWMRGQYIYYLLTYPANRSRVKMIRSIKKGKKDSKGMN